jgi:hypothetical protein
LLFGFVHDFMLRESHYSFGMILCRSHGFTCVDDTTTGPGERRVCCEDIPCLEA